MPKKKWVLRVKGRQQFSGDNSYHSNLKTWLMTIPLILELQIMKLNKTSTLDNLYFCLPVIINDVKSNAPCGNVIHHSMINFILSDLSERYCDWFVIWHAHKNQSSLSLWRSFFQNKLWLPSITVCLNIEGGFLVGRFPEGSFARSTGQHTETKRGEKQGEKWATNVWREWRHNSSHHGDPKRGQSSPRRLPEPKPLLALSLPSNLPCSFPRSWTGVRGSPWLSIKHTSTHTNTQSEEWKSSLEKPVFSLSLSLVSLQIALASCLLKSSVVHHSAAGLRALLFIFKPPVIPSIVISPPLRHPVSLSASRGESTLWRGADPSHPRRGHYINRHLSLSGLVTVYKKYN